MSLKWTGCKWRELDERGIILRWKEWNVVKILKDDRQRKQENFIHFIKTWRKRNPNCINNTGIKKSNQELKHISGGLIYPPTSLINCSSAQIKSIQRNWKFVENIYNRSQSTINSTHKKINKKNLHDWIYSRLLFMTIKYGMHLCAFIACTAVNWSCGQGRTLL